MLQIYNDSHCMEDITIYNNNAYRMLFSIFKIQYKIYGDSQAYEYNWSQFIGWSKCRKSL